MKRGLSLILCTLFLTASAALAQSSTTDPWGFPSRDRRRGDDDSEFIKEMLAKQQSEREKKEYATMIERGEAALELSKELETSFQKNEQLTPAEIKQLEEFEKLVVKIRDDLGGDDDGENEVAEKDGRPKDVREAFIVLRGATEKLVDEIKKSTRYSVSIVAIESSNTLIKIARVLRFWN
jgi:hypothetical protein